VSSGSVPAAEVVVNIFELILFSLIVWAIVEVTRYLSDVLGLPVPLVSYFVIFGTLITISLIHRFRRGGDHGADDA
jgi:hypothetical protein